MSACVPLAVMLVAMIPTLESKISLPFALSQEIWQDSALGLLPAYVCSVVGAMLPAFVVYYLCKFIKSKTDILIVEKFTTKLYEKYKKNSEKIEKSNNFNKYLLLCLFVAVPLPLTGVYSASVVSALCNLKALPSFLAIFIGELISAGITLILCLFFKNSIFFLLLITLCLIFIFVIFSFVWSKIKKLKGKKQY